MKILMVCLGNICRSPMAEGILRQRIAEKKLHMEVDSAGTGDWHAGENPDPRAIETAGKFGVDISRLVARQIVEDDFERFDRIFVMDRSNYSDVLSLAEKTEHKEKVNLLMNLLYPGENRDVPDPWYGGKEGFVRVFSMMDEAIGVLIRQVEAERQG